MKPDASNHNPDPDYLRGLIERAGLNQVQAAERIGITPRTMRAHLSPRLIKSHTDAPYPVQYALESLAADS